MQVLNRFSVFMATLIGLLLLTACGPDYHFKESVDIPNDDWTYDQVLDFEFEITDTLQIYNLILDITHHKDYAYQNLYTQISTYFPSGEAISKTLSLELANTAGQWQGKCSGTYCTLRIPIQEGAYFNIPGIYKISLAQFMRSDPTRGVKNISFFVEKTEHKRGE